jgi:hypothetical protein
LLKVFAEVEKSGNGSVTRHALIKGILVTGKSQTGTEDKGTTGSSSTSSSGSGSSSSSTSGESSGRGGAGGSGRGSGGRPGGFGFRGQGSFGPPSASQLMERFDKDHKGMLTKTDVPEFVWNRISKADTDNNGSVSKDELETYFKNNRPSRGPGASPPSKPDDKPADVKPQELKPADPKPTARNSDVEQPADATTATNVASSSSAIH